MRGTSRLGAAFRRSGEGGKKKRNRLLQTGIMSAEEDAVTSAAKPQLPRTTTGRLAGALPSCPGSLPTSRRRMFPGRSAHGWLIPTGC